MSETRQLYCGFCGISQKEAKVMVAGPVDAAICCECVELAREAVDKKRQEMRLEREAKRCTFCMPEQVILS